MKVTARFERFEAAKAYADQRRGTAGIGNHHRRSLRQLTGRSPDADAVLVGQRDGAFADRAAGAVFGVADAIGLW